MAIVETDTGAKQETTWLGFYEGAWKARSEFLRQLIEDRGLHDAYAAIQALNRYEAQHELHLDLQSGQPVFRKRAFDATVEEMMPSGRPFETRTSFREKFVTHPTYGHPVEFLLDLLDREKFDAVVELGSGFSQNLIEIFYRGGPRDIPYYAGEYTQSGTELAAYLKQHTPGMNLIPFRFDHRLPDLSPVKHKGRVLIYTCHTIEQVTEVPDQLFLTIRDHFETALCVHFEPFGFQYETQDLPFGEVSKSQEKYFNENRWNQNLLPKLMKLAAQREIELMYLAKNIMSGVPECPTSVAMWRKPL